MQVQPLGDQVPFQSGQALLDGPRIDGIAKTDMALALPPEDHPGNGGNMRLGEQHPGRIAAILADLGHPGKSIESPLRHLAGKADLVQSVNQQIPSLPVLLAPRINLTARNPQGLQCGPLRHGGDSVDRIQYQLP
jgi:hypothetical protein